MVADYMSIYEDLIAGRFSRPRRNSGSVPIDRGRLARPA
jgi:hypothetical protein